MYIPTVGDFLKNVDKVKLLIPFIPLILVTILLIVKPYYLFPVGGDTNFHLAKARAILENPLYGIFWNNLTYYPMGQPVWHQPLFHMIYAFLWYLGGVRFAHSVMCISEILLTVAVASWIAKKEYGIVAGFFAGVFSLFGPVPATLIVAVPSAYIPILAVLTIYYIPRDKKKAFMTSLLALWTHMISLLCFLPLFIVDNYKNKKNLKVMALLMPFFIFWAGYWVYFKDKLVTGGAFYSFTHLYLSAPLNFQGLYSFLLLYSMGICGLYLLYKLNKHQFKLYLTYLLLVMGFSFFGFGGDFLRGFQFGALPMAILSGLTLQKGYEYISKNYKTAFLAFFLAFFLALSTLGGIFFVSELPEQNKGWNALNYPFEGKYVPLKEYLEHNTNKTDIIWTQPDLAEKVAWMTGRRVSNGLYHADQYGATRGFINHHQNINVYKSEEYFLIKDANNKTLETIKISIS